MIVFSLPGGQAADRLDRRTIIRSAQLLFAFCALALLVLSRLHAPVGFFYLVLATAAIGRAFSVPAVTSFFPTLVSRELLPNATTWNSTIFQTTAMVGPAIGGPIVAGAGPATSYVVNVVLAGLAFLTFSMTAPVTVKVDKPPVTWNSMVSGVRFVIGTRWLLGLFCLDLVAVLLSGATALLPIFSSDILHAGPRGYGLLRAAHWNRASPRWFGAVGSVLLGACGTLAVVGGETLVFPQIPKLGRLHEIKPAERARATEEELEEKATL